MKFTKSGAVKAVSPWLDLHHIHYAFSLPRSGGTGLPRTWDVTRPIRPSAELSYNELIEVHRMSINLVRSL